ncbi:MAG: cation-translocating P-type ATPase [Deltaproteobacteria bacterium]|nr:cation-translocating P-type ATPase [Deltaproteobacteria bacterium]
MPDPAPTWHDRTVADAAQSFGVYLEKGLGEDKAAAELRRVGPNELPRRKPPSAWKVFLAQFLNPLVLSLLAAAAVATVAAVWHADPTLGFLARYSDAIAILLIVVLNAAIGYVQERKAERALESLQAMLTFNARVVRDGQERVVPARELVPGDVVVLEAGDHVPADVRLGESSDCRTDESPLTGESTPVEKDAARVLEPATTLADRVNRAFMGTMAVRGRARAIVVATGVGTEIGRIGKLIGEISSGASPLEQRLARFSRQILFACLALSLLLFAFGLIRGGFTVWGLLLTAVSLAVAGIPEGLPAITTITLALGMQRMARRGALIRSLPAVETLGSATVICTDKTGTLTLNDMQVRRIATLRHEYGFTEGACVGGGSLTLDGRVTRLEEHDDLRELVRASVVPNHAVVRPGPDGKLAGEGDPTEVAILICGANLGVPRDSVLDEMSLVASNPFDSDRRRMSLIFQSGPSGELTSYVKGGVDEILGRCDHVRDGSGSRPLTEDDRRTIHERAEAMAEQALRVLAVAHRHVESDADAEAAERGLEFLGLIGMQDPPRPEAMAAIRRCRDAGIKVVMITGDHAVTARAIAREMQFWEEGDLAVTGQELEALTDDALTERIERVRIFARVTAEQKLRIVRAWKRRGGVVAMTGDGVNDAPALREADLGVAMGKGGTDVAREAAKMVLTDNNFASIVAAVEEGRTILRNIRKSIVFLLSSNTGLALTVFFSVFFPSLLVLTPLQILWINLVTNGAPALGLGVDPPEPGEMQNRPRPVAAGLLDPDDLWFLLGFGLLIGAIGIGSYLLPPSLLPAAATAAGSRTLAFFSLAFLPLVHAFNCRARRASIFSRDLPPNRFLWVAVLSSAALQLLANLVVGLHGVFRVVALGPRDWLMLAAASLAVLPVWEIAKAVLRARDRARTAP